MSLFINLFILFIFMVSIEARWNLEWNDEFEQKDLDKKKWEIDGQDIKICDPQNIGRLNCYTNSSKNIRLIDGTLSLVAINEKRLNKNYTSAWIRTVKNFTFGRIDIRASLPIAKMLAPYFKLLGARFRNRDGHAKHNQIVVFRNDQTNWIQQNVDLGKKIQGNMEDYLTNGALNEFHTYSVEWNETDLIWKFDGIQTNWLNLTGVNTFLNQPVILIYYLRVGGNPFRNGVLTFDDVYDWDCSLLTLDYIRYYQWTDEEEVHSNQTEPIERSSVDFCKNVMDEIRPKRDVPATSNVNLTAIISVISLLLLLTLIPSITWLVIRMKKIRDPVRKGKDTDNYYDDINNNMEMFEEVNKVDNYDYADYQMNYSKNKNYYIKIEPDAVSVISQNDQDNDYITMKTEQVKKPHQYLQIYPQK